jgi:hypothetical protein
LCFEHFFFKGSDEPFCIKTPKHIIVAFKKLGYRLEIKALPNKKSLSWASHGVIDGKSFRIKALNLDDAPRL